MYSSGIASRITLRPAEDGTVYTSPSCLQSWLISPRDSGRLWLVSMSFLTAETHPARPFLILCTHTHNVTMTIDTAEWLLCVFILERSTVSSFSSIRRLSSRHTAQLLLAGVFHSNVPPPPCTLPLSDPSLFKCLYTCRQEESIKGRATYTALNVPNESNEGSFIQFHKHSAINWICWSRVSSIGGCELWGTRASGISSTHTVWWAIFTCTLS